MLMVSLSFMGTFILLIILSFYGTKLQDLIITRTFYVLRPKYDLPGLFIFVTPDRQNIWSTQYRLQIGIMLAI